MWIWKYEIEDCYGKGKGFRGMQNRQPMGDSQANGPSKMKCSLKRLASPGISEK